MAWVGPECGIAKFGSSALPDSGNIGPYLAYAQIPLNGLLNAFREWDV